MGNFPSNSLEGSHSSVCTSEICLYTHIGSYTIYIYIKVVADVLQRFYCSYIYNMIIVMCIIIVFIILYIISSHIYMYVCYQCIYGSPTLRCLPFKSPALSIPQLIAEMRLIAGSGGSGWGYYVFLPSRLHSGKLT